MLASFFLREDSRILERVFIQFFILNLKGSPREKISFLTLILVSLVACGSQENNPDLGLNSCVTNSDCQEAGLPLCSEAGECVSCEAFADGDAACSELDAASPLCVSGACVQCTASSSELCTGETPICDEASNICVPCTAHEQCGEAACNLFTGACLPADAVVHVGVGQDFATITEAVASFGPGEEGTIILHEDSYDESVVVGGGRVLAFLRLDFLYILGGEPSLQWGATAAPQLSVNDATVILDKIGLVGNNSGQQALVLQGGKVWVDRSFIVFNQTGGILAENSAELVLRNSFVKGELGEIALEVNNASAQVLYSTLANISFSSVPALKCTNPIDLEVRNSIIVTQQNVDQADDIDCEGALITYSATESVLAGEGNVSVGNFYNFDPTLWFVGYLGGDYHLQNDGLTVFQDIARWQSGDPKTDIDGDLRPTVDGSPDYAGADVP